MDHKLSIVFSALSAAVSALFGIQIAVAFLALAGSFLSLRFRETMPIYQALSHVFWSTVAGCAMTPIADWLFPHIPLGPVAFAFGFLAMQVGEWISKNGGELWTRLSAKWLP